MYEKDRMTDFASGTTAPWCADESRPPPPCPTCGDDRSTAHTFSELALMQLDRTACQLLSTPATIHHRRDLGGAYGADALAVLGSVLVSPPALSEAVCLTGSRAAVLPNPWCLLNRMPRRLRGALAPLPGTLSMDDADMDKGWHLAARSVC